MILHVPAILLMSNSVVFMHSFELLQILFIIRIFDVTSICNKMLEANIDLRAPVCDKIVALIEEKVEFIVIQRL